MNDLGCEGSEGDVVADNDVVRKGRGKISGNGSWGYLSVGVIGGQGLLEGYVFLDRGFKSSHLGQGDDGACGRELH